MEKPYTGLTASVKVGTGDNLQVAISGAALKSGYDGEVVQKVEKVTVKLEMDTDIDFLDSLVDMQDSTEELTVVKLDGDWYIFK